MDAPRTNRTVQTASHWGVYNVEVDARGQVVRTTPFKSDPHPPSYLASLPETVRSPLRIAQPCVRAGYLQRERTRNRGGEPFVPVGWDEALDLIAHELQRVKDVYGNEAIYGGSYGWASAGRLHHSPSVLKRFLGLHGGYVDKRGNHSFGAALQIAPYILGRSDITEMVVPWADVVASAELVVMFGGASLKNTQIDAGGAVAHESPDWFRRAAAAGIRFVNISPSRQDLSADVKADWIALRPNTDVALMLGIAHTLEKEGLCDREFLARFPVVDGIDAACATLAALMRFGARHQAPQRVPALARTPLAAEAFASEASAKDALAEAGLPVPQERVAASRDEALAAARALGFPLVLKIVSPDIAHKTEVGGVFVGVRSEAQLLEEYANLLERVTCNAPQARITGVLVAQMVQGGVELILGSKKDPVFGPMVMVGLGGIFAEILKDVALEPAPVDPARAMAMLRSLKAFALLDGARGRPKADVEAAANAIVALSRFASRHVDSVSEIDINPLMVLDQGRGAYALDALLVQDEGATLKGKS